MLSYGFGVRTHLADVGRHLDRLLAPFRSRTNGGPTYEVGRAADGSGRFEVELGGECVQRANSLGPLIDFVLWDASTKAVEHAEGYLVLHAGAVSWRDHGILVPAPPDSGKTTLAAGLTVAGCSYLTDEAALVHLGSRRLHPFPRALWLEDPSISALARLGWHRPATPSDLGRSRHVSADDLRPGSVGRTCRIRYVIAPRYRRGSATALELMSRAEAIVLLAENSLNLRGFGAEGLRVLRDVVRGAECYRLRMGELGAAVERVMDVVEEGVGRR